MERDKGREGDRVERKRGREVERERLSGRERKLENMRDGQGEPTGESWRGERESRRERGSGREGKGE